MCTERSFIFPCGPVILAQRFNRCYFTVSMGGPRDRCICHLFIMASPLFSFAGGVLRVIEQEVSDLLFFNACPDLRASQIISGVEDSELRCNRFIQCGAGVSPNTALSVNCTNMLIVLDWWETDHISSTKTTTACKRWESHQSPPFLFTRKLERISFHAWRYFWPNINKSSFFIAINPFSVFGTNEPNCYFLIKTCCFSFKLNDPASWVVFIIHCCVRFYCSIVFIWDIYDRCR